MEFSAEEALRMAVTLKDIAKRTGVSYSTVSRAVNQETADLVNLRTREKILRAVEKYGYIPNRYSRSLKVNVKQTRIIGFASALFPHIFMGEFLGKIMSGAFEECEKRRYDIELFPVIHGDAGEISKQLLFGQILDGILIFGYETAADFFDRLIDLNTPHVIVNSYDPSAKQKNFVYCDSSKSDRMAMAVERQETGMLLGQCAVQLLDDLIEKRVLTPAHVEVPVRSVAQDSTVAKPFEALNQAV